MPLKFTRSSIRTATLVVTAIAVAFALNACDGAKGRQARYTQRGQQYLAAGNLQKARVEFRNALQIAPNDADLRYYNGLVAEKLGNIRDAAGFYSGAIDLNKDHIKARASLGHLFVFAGLSDRALEQVNPGLATHPNDVDLLTVHSVALHQKGKEAEALADAQRAVSLDPKNESAVANLAGLEMTAGKMDEAQKLVEDSIKQAPDVIPLYAVLVRIYLDRKNAAGAERTLLTLIHLQPGERVHRVQLAQLYAQTSRVDEAEKTLRKAVADLPEDEDAKRSLVEFLWARRGREVAETQIKQMIAAAPSDAELRFTLASLYEMSGSFPAAEHEYQDLIARQGHNTFGLRARDRLAVLYTGRNDNSGARKLVDEVLEQNPGDNDALGVRAYEELLRGEAEAAITDLRRVLRDQPGATKLLGLLSRAYVADGEPDLAEEAARRAVDIDPSDVASRIELAQVLLGRGKFADGRTILLELNKQRPDDATVLNLLCRASLALNEASAAQSEADDLVKLRPSWSPGYVYRGLVAEAAGRTDDALAEYRHAFELQPEAVEPLTAMTRLLERAKRFDEATRFLHDVSQKQKTNALAPELEGEALLAQTGHVEQAEASFRESHARAPKWWNAYRGLTYAALAKSDTPGAARWLKEAIAQAQLSEADRLELAGLLTGAGHPDEAIDQYEAILKVRPKSQVASGALAMLLVSYRTDQTSYNRAAGLVRPLASSNDWRLLDAFGWVLYKNEDLNAALPALEKAASSALEGRGVRQPDLAEVRFHLAMAELKAGQNDMAEKNLAAACAHDDHFFGRDEAKAVLAQLRSRKT
jgi:tetratricopeptide (TPR) repeat protein